MINISGSLDNVNLDDDAFVDGVPHETFALLRQVSPVHWTRWKGGDGYWSITRYNDILNVLKDWKRFTSERGANLENWDGDQSIARRSMLEMDPPRHTSLRKIVSMDFSPRAVARYESFVRDITKTIVEQTLKKREFDFVDQFAAQIPMRVFARIMGVPEEDTEKLIAWGDELMGNTDPEVTEVTMYSEESEKYRLYPFRNPAALKVFEYGRWLRRHKWDEPRQDVLTKLAHADVEGRSLMDWEFDNMFLLLITAGHETTRQAIVHGVEALIRHPDQIRRLQNDASLMQTAVEEILRWATPILHFRRTVKEDVELHGKKLRAGDKVVLWFISGNRDEEIFPDPFYFDVGRAPNEHLTFGKVGVHYCLGAYLARLEIRVVFEELLPYLHRFELAGKPVRMRSNFTHGIRFMPVKVVTD
ncbi:cytochrome P450 [Kyrpidia spormannii]|uniref:Cytochrome P450 n=1 Tax=Kyrpidia spormannii TaxID=2055160 RepID=A0ACA8ZCK8_9BACL|nr:cytochrome P450 [Kyrpidia spormannii]CAB3394638.1 Cytochrome P450 [Kyrpidia spormannii]